MENGENCIELVDWISKINVQVRKFLARGIKIALVALVIDLRRGVKMTDGRNDTKEPRQRLLFSSPPFIYSPRLNVTREEVMSRLRYLTPRKSLHAHA